MAYVETGPRTLNCASNRSEVIEMTVWDDNDFPTLPSCSDFVGGGQEELRAYAYVASILPAFRIMDDGVCVDRIYLSNFSVTEEIATCKYKVRAEYSDTRKNDPNYCKLDFEVGGNSVNMKVALAHVADYSCDGSVPCSYEGAINVDGEGPQGIDRRSNGLRFSITKCFLPSSITCAYVQSLYYQAPSFNSAPVLGCFAPGEVLFLGASGSGDLGSLFCVKFDFEAQPNWYGGPPGCTPNPCLSPIFKLGWDYVWFDYEPVINRQCGAHLVRPKGAHVERVYCPSNFASLLLACTNYA